MLEPKSRIFTVRFSQAEWAKIDHLAKATDRTRGGVIRRLLTLATRLPETERLLMDLEQSEANHEDTK